MNPKFAALVLAGGRSKRFHSTTPKILHELLDQPMLAWVCEALLELKEELARSAQGELLTPLFVVTPPREHVSETQWEPLRAQFPSLERIPQPEPLGTGDAVRVALPHLPEASGILILSGDTPCLRAHSLKALFSRYREQGGGIVFMTAELPEPRGYGRVVRHGKRIRIVEERDATPEEKRIHLVNAGIYLVDPALLKELLPRITPKNAQGEYYLVDLIALAQELPHPPPVSFVEVEDAGEIMGVNDRFQFAQALKLLNHRIQRRWAEQGVTFLAPETTWVGRFVAFEEDVVVEPFVILKGKTRISRGSRIGAGSILTRVEVGEGVLIRPYVVAEEVVIEGKSVIGPFTHLRPNTVIREGSHVGNFVEMKNTRFGPFSKANHLSYLGDAEVGREVNVGAGTITCNYDGISKHPTIIEDRVFIGSDTQLVAPVRVGHDAYIGAGTTVTRDVSPEALAISRTPQQEIPGYARRRRGRKAQGKRE